MLVRIAASGVNPLDMKIHAGAAEHARHTLPAILGIDLAGTVEAIGPGVTRFRPGDEVFGMTGGVGGHQGSLAEYAAVDADLLALKPANLSMREASVVPLVFITAWEGLVDRMAVRAGPDRAGAGRRRRRRPDGDPDRPRPRRRGVRDRLGIQPADDRALGARLHRPLGAGGGVRGAPDRRARLRPRVRHRRRRGAGRRLRGRAPVRPRGQRARLGHARAWRRCRSAPASYSGVFTLLPLLTGEGRAHHGEILAEATRLAEAGQLIAVAGPAPVHAGRRWTTPIA